MTGKEIASHWRFEDNFLVHVESGEMLSAFKDGSMYLAPNTADLRLLDVNLNSILDGSFGIVKKLLEILDFLKVKESMIKQIFVISFHLKDLKFEAQQWKLTTVAFVTCPELGPELELFERGHAFSHFRSDTECMDSVQPVMTAYSNNHPKGTIHWSKQISGVI